MKTICYAYHLRTIHNVGLVSDTIYAAFEYAKHGDLRAFVRKNPVEGWIQGPSLNMYLRVARDVATGLTQLARLGVGVMQYKSLQMVLAHLITITPHT